MSENQELSVMRGLRVAGLVSVAALVAACGSLPFFGSRGETMESTPAPVVETAPAPSAEPDVTATEAAIAGMNDAPAASAAPAQSPIRPDAPLNYTVKRGDTLWDISSLFLRDPWLWPEIWQINPQVENPHLIYPGDVLSLAYGADGQPQIRISQYSGARMSPRLRSTDIDGPIATIPYGAIAAFLSRPTVVTTDQAKTAPHVLAFRDERMIAGGDNEIYVRNLASQANSRYSVIHVGDEIRDPESGDVLGYVGTYTATATVTRSGDPAKAVLSDAARETLAGDRLIATDTAPAVNFMPRSPRRAIDGQIVSVVDGVELVGQYQIVVINRGTRHGVEVGHVLAVDQAGEMVRDRHAARSFLGVRVGSSLAPRVQLPNERSGTMLVFKTYDRMSYGLIVAATDAITVADRVRNP